MKRNQTGPEIKGPLSYTDDFKTLLEKIPEKISFLYIVQNLHRKIKIYFEYLYVFFFIHELFLKGKTQEDHLQPFEYTVWVFYLNSQFLDEIKKFRLLLTL